MIFRKIVSQNNSFGKLPVSFQLKSGDRLRIEGANGSGKTTLLKLITGQLQPQEGTLTRTDFSYVYLNQEYSIIDDRNSILEQAYAFNSRNLPEHEIKNYSKPLLVSCIRMGQILPET